MANTPSQPAVDFGMAIGGSPTNCEASRLVPHPHAARQGPMTVTFTPSVAVTGHGPSA